MGKLMEYHRKSFCRHCRRHTGSYFGWVHSSYHDAWWKVVFFCMKCGETRKSSKWA